MSKKYTSHDVPGTLTCDLIGVKKNPFIVLVGSRLVKSAKGKKRRQNFSKLNPTSHRISVGRKKKTPDLSREGKKGGKMAKVTKRSIEGSR